MNSQLRLENNEVTETRDLMARQTDETIRAEVRYTVVRKMMPGHKAWAYLEREAVLNGIHPPEVSVFDEFGIAGKLIYIRHDAVPMSGEPPHVPLQLIEGLRTAVEQDMQKIMNRLRSMVVQPKIFSDAA